jgi:hypothetical protein
MRRLFTSAAFVALIVASSAAANAQVSVGIQIGTPPPPHAYRVPARPGPDYVWVEGYQYPVNGKYRWHDGYWTRPPYQGAYWVAPYHSGGRYYEGRWEGDHNVNHNHKWDKSKDRDYNHR